MKNDNEPFILRVLFYLYVKSNDLYLSMEEPKEIIEKLIDSICSGDIKKFAELCNRKPQQIRDWKNGHRKPTLTNFLLIVKSLKAKNINIDFNEIFDI